MKKVTLKDIARDTGYSISTVSRVLNGSQKISTSTRDKIFESVDKLNYSSSLGSNGYTQTKLLHIVLAVSGFHTGEFYASYFKGFTEAAEQYNILLSIICLYGAKENFIKRAEMLSKTNDGLILYTPEYSRSDYLNLQERLPSSFPVVSNGLIESPVFSTLTFDSYSGGHLAAEHFKQKAYTTCGVIKGPIQKVEARYRYNGFADYVKQQQNRRINWEFQGDFSFETGIKAFEAYKNTAQKPRAIFSCNDAMSHGFMEAATKEGYTFPGDIAIIGFDDLP